MRAFICRFFESDGGRTSRRYIPIVAQASTAYRRPNPLSRIVPFAGALCEYQPARELRYAAWHKVRPEGRPEFGSVMKALNSLGVQLHAEPKATKVV